MDTCDCDKPATSECEQCGRAICKDVKCATDTVYGYFCGTYELWGCAKKFTTCDECEYEKAFHEDDFNVCVECFISRCEICTKTEFVSCIKCGELMCEECVESHDC